MRIPLSKITPNAAPPAAPGEPGVNLVALEIEGLPDPIVVYQETLDVEAASRFMSALVVSGAVTHRQNTEKKAPPSMTVTDAQVATSGKWYPDTTDRMVLAHLRTSGATRTAEQIATSCVLPIHDADAAIGRLITAGSIVPAAGHDPVAYRAVV